MSTAQELAKALAAKSDDDLIWVIQSTRHGFTRSVKAAAKRELQARITAQRVLEESSK